MGFIGSLFSSNKGMGYTPNVQLDQLANTQQADEAYHQVNDAYGTQQAFTNAVMAQNGLGNQASVFSQQQGLANQLGQLAQGVGPNPALAQLQMQTGNNVAQQAALMAGQRGASQNAGLLARQMAMQGAGIQQQAVGQSSVLQAQQQLAAQQALMQQQQAMAQTAGTQVGQQQQATNSLNQNAQGKQGLMLNAINAQDQNKIAKEGLTAGVQGKVAEGQSGLIGGALKGLSSAGSAIAAMSHGGMVGPRSRAAKHLAGSYKAGGRVGGHAKVRGDSLKNDTVPALLSPGEIVVPRSHAKDPDKAAAFARAVAMCKGGMSVRSK